MKRRAYFPESNIAGESQILREHKSQISHEHKSQTSRDCEDEDREFSRHGKLCPTRRETGGYYEKIQASRIQGRVMETRMMRA